MNIEKEYILATDDYINFQQYFLRKMSKKYSSYEGLIIYLPIFYIIFSANYISDYAVKIIGLIISISLFFYYIIISILSTYINEHFLKRRYYQNDISDNVIIKINENSITECYKYFEQKIAPQWVHEFEENDNYIYLRSNKNSVLILPKKYFSKEELEIVKEYYSKKE
jgi:hypothetical protein